MLPVYFCVLINNQCALNVSGKENKFAGSEVSEVNKIPSVPNVAPKQAYKAKIIIQAQEEKIIAPKEEVAASPKFVEKQVNVEANVPKMEQKISWWR